jgi:hypothetical protein
VEDQSPNFSNAVQIPDDFPRKMSLPKSGSTETERYTICGPICIVIQQSSDLHTVRCYRHFLELALGRAVQLGLFLFCSCALSESISFGAAKEWTTASASA